MKRKGIEKRGPTISLQHDQGNTGNTPTGRLDKRTVLHKRYMILRTIGQGGMGAVYQARDMRRNAVCAIKEMSLAEVSPDERTQAVQNFKGEAKLLASLDHPNLPTVTGLFSEGQRYFLVMEYIEGQTLEEMLENNGGPFPERRVLGWARQLCDVLEYLHSQHPPIIFRDMKPGNIMLTKNGRIKLIDFGIARFFRHASSRDTQMLGTPGFAPPEQYGKAQTDERSDIYSLAITIFQLMTNTLSEKGFGLKDIRSINPNISPNVARALEKAASLSPEDRYDSVAAFRRALLGVGTFLFEDGNQATTPEELAELSARYPEEAADYLYSGEFESWFHEIGDFDLARATRQIRISISDPTAAIERFLQVIMGPGAHIRGANATSTMTGTTISGTTIQRPRVSRGWLSRKPASMVVVEPEVLDFGQVYPGMSAPLSLTISGDRGILVNGDITPSEQWILVDRISFDGMSTRVNVRVNSTQLSGASRFTGIITIQPYSENGEVEPPVQVKVRVELLGITTSTINGRSRPGLSRSIPFDDDDDTLVSANGNSGNGMVMKPPQQRSRATQNPPSQVPAYNNPRYNEYRTKYGQPGGTTSNVGNSGNAGNAGNPGASAGWDPMRTASTQQRTWLQRGLTLFAAFMAGSLSFTLISQIPAVGKASPLPPNPWFIAVLIAMIPASTLGALLVGWSRKNIINRFCTGLVLTLVVSSIGELLWQSAHLHVPGLELFTMLLLNAIAAFFGINETVSRRIFASLTWAMSKLRWVIIVALILAGGFFGFALTTAFTTLFGILLGIAIAVILVLRVDRLIKQNTP